MNDLARRLHALERELNGPAAIKSEHEWLAGFEKFHKKGAFSSEPDFGTALDAYRAAIVRRKPAPSLNATLPEWAWLHEMFMRVKDGKPAVTEAEFRELASWFRASHADTAADAPIDLGEGPAMRASEVLAALYRGPRRLGVTALVEGLRRLKSETP